MWPIVGIARSAGVATRPANATGVAGRPAGGSESLHKRDAGNARCGGLGLGVAGGTGGGVDVLLTRASLSDAHGAAES